MRLYFDIIILFLQNNIIKLKTVQ